MTRWRCLSSIKIWLRMRKDILTWSLLSFQRFSSNCWQECIETNSLWIKTTCKVKSLRHSSLSTQVSLRKLWLTKSLINASKKDRLMFRSSSKLISTSLRKSSGVLKKVKNLCYCLSPVIGCMQMRWLLISLQWYRRSMELSLIASLALRMRPRRQSTFLIRRMFTQ